MKNVGSAALETDHFFELTPDIVCIAGKDGYFKKVNQSLIKKLGYPQEELFAQPVSSFIHPEDKELTRLERVKLLEGDTLINFQNRYLTKPGDVIWFDWTSIYFPDKEIVFAIAKDITSRKKIEQDVEASYRKFKNLASHFKSKIEKDRKYFAVELHESVAQLAAAIKMDIDWIRHDPQLTGVLKSRVDHASAVSELLINTIQRISFSVSPYMLDDLGLSETLTWLCKEFTILNKMPCNFKGDYDETALTQEIKIDFFRICQEALSNIFHHAHAGVASIRIDTREGKIILSIADDGKGFKMEELKQQSGVTTMRELATSIHGQFDMESEVGKGTRVLVTVDLPAASR